ncbi:hypothetical protein [Gordonia hongkongensis]|uniref:hypothetical protein n=1 Tax=Gordonia hongkongensis TaxID=1701090 RepID=UPI003D73D693
MATNVRIFAVRFGAGNALVDSEASAETFPSLTAARDAAEALHGPITWRPTRATPSSWAIGSPSAKPSAYRTAIVVAPASRGLSDVVAELKRLDGPADLNEIRDRILTRQGKTPAPKDTEEATPA